MKQITWAIYQRKHTHLMTMAGWEAHPNLVYLESVNDALTLAQRIHTLSKSYPDLWIRVTVEEI